MNLTVFGLHIFLKDKIKNDWQYSYLLIIHISEEPSCYHPKCSAEC